MSITQTYRRLLWPLYIPSALFSVALQGALLLIPLYMLDLGYGAALASFVVGLRGVGMLVADIPTGSLATRYGDRPIMVLGSIGVGVGCLMVALSENIWILSLGSLIAGFSSAAWLVGRLSFISETCIPEEKGRVIALMAGTQRFGSVAGPAIGGIMAATVGFELSLAVAGIVAIASGILTQFTSDNVGSGKQHGASPLQRLSVILSEHKKLFLTAGFSTMSLMTLRSTRQLVIPLFGVAIGLDAAQVGFVYAISAAVDMSMFYPAGMIMDRYGRKASAIPGTLLMATGMLILPFADSYLLFLIVACIIGLGNGVATGVLMAMGSDFSPSVNRGEFLGVWRFTSDMGFAGGPLIISGLTALASLGAATITVSGIGYCGAYVLAKFVPESMRRTETANTKG